MLRRVNEATYASWRGRVIEKHSPEIMSTWVSMTWPSGSSAMISFSVPRPRNSAMPGIRVSMRPAPAGGGVIGCGLIAVAVRDVVQDPLLEALVWPRENAWGRDERGTLLATDAAAGLGHLAHVVALLVFRARAAFTLRFRGPAAVLRRRIA